MGEFQKWRLPDPIAYFDSEGITLTGNGRWRTGRCELHGGSDSLRVNVESGAWRCMACHAKGGDVLSYAMQRHCLDFIAAARSLGAYVDDGRTHRGAQTPATLGPRDAMQLMVSEVQLAFIVIADVMHGIVPSPDDWARFIACGARLIQLAEEYRP